jgi:hypothetical protein
MDIGTESMKDQEQVIGTVGEVPSYDAAIELMEAALLMQTESEELSGLVTLEDNLTDIAASMKTNQIDAGTEALVGKELLSFCGKFDKTDVPGTIAAVEAGLEGVGEKIMTYIKKLIENMKQFLEKLVFNRDIIVKSYRKQMQRVKLLGAKAGWAKKEKTFQGVGKPSDIAGIKENCALINEVLTMLNSGVWTMSAAKGGEMASGIAVKKLREAAKKSNGETFKCSDESATKFVADAAMGETIITGMLAFDNLRNQLKSFKMKPIKKEVSDIKPARMVSYCNQYIGMIGIICVRSIRALNNILRNIK